MYRSAKQRHLPCALAQGIVRPSAERRMLLMLTFILASATVALWLAYPSMLTGSVLNSLSVEPQHLTGTSVNRLNKADRLSTTTFAQRWNGVATTVAQRSQNSVPIPDGCKPALGSLQTVENVSHRCITSFGATTRVVS